MTRFAIGDVTVSAIWEMEDTSFQMRTFFPLVTDEMLAEERPRLAPAFYDPESDRIRLSIHAWLIDTGRHRILVDTCVGNDKQRHARKQWSDLKTPFLDRLRAAGVEPEEIDYVCCTHLHADHVGWNTRLLDGRWVPTFPNARYIFGRKEYDYWAEKYGSDPGSHHLAAYCDSVLPVVEAGQVVLVDDGYELDGCLTFKPAPGHTPGHVAIWLKSNGRECVFSGDIIHHPIQLRYPQLSCMGCEDQALSARTRTALLGGIADTDTMLMTGHFLAPHAAHIETDGESFRMRCSQC